MIGEVVGGRRRRQTDRRGDGEAGYRVQRVPPFCRAIEPNAVFVMAELADQLSRLPIENHDLVAVELTDDEFSRSRPRHYFRSRMIGFAWMLFVRPERSQDIAGFLGRTRGWPIRR